MEEEKGHFNRGRLSGILFFAHLFLKIFFTGIFFFAIGGCCEVQNPHCCDDGQCEERWRQWGLGGTRQVPIYFNTLLRTRLFDDFISFFFSYSSPWYSFSQDFTFLEIA